MKKSISSDLNQYNQGGYKLNSVEILNWGTFDKVVWRLEPSGFNALITGENGSGKSTLVDALLTLLVANNKRSYNLSSGNGRRERSESSYVRGAFGKQQDSLGGSKVKYCRQENDTYSVLLAQFKNDLFKDTLTLVQFFWMENGELKKFFLTSLQSLSIEKNFSNFKTPQELKKNCKQLPHTKIHDNFSDYQQTFLHHFGPKSFKAMDLFNQVVAIKEIGSLSDFVRKHMLEEYSVEDLLTQLFTNYDNLSAAFTSILTSRAQLEILTPIGEMSQRVEKLKKELEDLELEEKKIPLYFNLNRKNVLLEKIKNTQDEEKIQENTLVNLDHTLLSLQKQKNEILMAINQNGNGAQLEKLQLQIQHLREKKKECLKNFSIYEKMAKKLGLNSSPTIKSFQKNIDVANSQFLELKEKESQLQSKNYDLKKEKDLELERQKEILYNLENLKKTKGNIPLYLSQVRDEICHAVGVTKNEIPFVSELIQVQSAESSVWNQAIEKLLHSLAMRILVPLDLYSKVNKYLSKNNIGIKLIYNKVDLDEKLPSITAEHYKNKLYSKLDFMSKSPYSKWVKNQITTEYNFLCTHDLQEFQSGTKVLMPTGLIKRGNFLHEKDDRKFQGSILGWDNTLKMSELSDSFSKSKGISDDLTKKLKKIEEELSENQINQLLLRDFLKIENFSHIDWEEMGDEENKLVAHKDKINSGSILQLEKNVNELDHKIDENQIKRDGVLAQMALIKESLKNDPHELSQCEKVIEAILSTQSFSLVDPNLFKFIERKLKKQKSNNGHFINDQLSSFYLLQKELVDQFRADKGDLEQKFHQENLQILKKMTQFKIKFPEASNDLQASMEYLPSYLKVLHTLETEGLPSHEKRFKALLNKSLFNDMAAFKSTLESAYDEISENIKNLNESLKEIPYSHQSYVQLNLARSKNIEIREFNNMLRNAMKTKSSDQIDLEGSFTQIKKILDRLKADPSWCKEVTDVRNWADFFVLELGNVDHEQRNYYADSSGLSGGQKAKLAFTILASAIAFQYGLNKENAHEKSFRFVVIDEAFSKSDEKNSRYAMELFLKLGLQLFVVTPKDKIQVAEPYIKNIFHTSINEEHNASKIMTLKIEEFTMSH